MVNTEIRLIIFFAAKDGEALYSQQKQDQELTVAQTMISEDAWGPVLSWEMGLCYPRMLVLYPPCPFNFSMSVPAAEGSHTGKHWGGWEWG